jgi:3-dehydroquinate dehydratase/shikimate dehydrogenase
VIPGLEMFVQQGARQFEIWTGKPSPIAEMAYVVSKALERQAAEEVGEEPEPPPKKAASKPAKKAVKKAVKAAKKR